MSWLLQVSYLSINGWERGYHLCEAVFALKVICHPVSSLTNGYDHTFFYIASEKMSKNINCSGEKVLCNYPVPETSTINKPIFKLSK